MCTGAGGQKEREGPLPAGAPGEGLAGGGVTATW